MENIKNMTPQEIVNELDKYIIGQKEAKRNVTLTPIMRGSCLEVFI